MQNEDWIKPILNEAKRNNLFRTLPVYPLTGSHITMNGRSFLNFSSNDYLNLSSHPDIVATAQQALETYGAGATASRLVTGTLPLHEQLETTIAAHKGYERALVYGSGFMTNIGIVASLLGADDHIFADRLIHASLIDAARLSRARLHRFRHNDPAHLETQLRKSHSEKKLIITESVFSMDGDLAPLRDLAQIAQTHEAMFMVDEAHATGIFGPNGSGRICELNLQDKVNFSMGTLSKAMGGYGGFTACSKQMRNYLVNKSRSFIYSTAPPPAVLGAALGAFKLLDQHPTRGSELLSNASHFRNRLNQAGINTLNSGSQIIPVVVGDTATALALSAALKDRGILAVAIRPPTVPQGTARLRFSVSHNHTIEELEYTADAIIQLAEKEGLI